MSRKKKKTKGKESEKPLDGRSAARALKAALADSEPKTKAKDKIDQPLPAPRRRRPPTSHGPMPKRPVAPALPKTKPRRVPGMQRPTFHRRHDLAVLAIALTVLASGILISRSLVETAPRRFDRLGLRLNRPSVFLPPQLVSRPASEDARLPYHVIYQAPSDPNLKLEVYADGRPALGNMAAALALHRASLYGDMVWLAGSEDVNIGGRVWLKSRYRYAYKADPFDSPRVATAIEAATLNGSLIYVVTLHGEDDSADELADFVIPTLAVDPNHAAATAVRESP